MNRRSFLKSLTATAAALAYTGPVVAIAPRALTHEEILALCKQRMQDALALMKRNIAEQLFTQAPGQSGGLCALLESVDQEGEWQFREISTELIFREPTA